MNSAGRQIAKLYLRGTWFNRAMSDLDQDGMTEIDEIISLVMNDPNLQGAKNEFCASLGRTIGFEYKDHEVALQDYRIAVMRGAIAAKFGWGKNPPKPAVITDPIQRKKFFQSWVFNYLRQILWENKIPGYKKRKKLKLPAELAAVKVVREILTEACDNERNTSLKKVMKNLLAAMIVQEKNENHYEIVVDHFSFPIDVMFRIQEAAQEYLKYNVRIMQEVDRIIVKIDNDTIATSNLDVHDYEEVRVSLVSFNIDDDDGNFSDCIEFEAQKNKDNKVEGMMNKDLGELRNRLPEDVIPVFDIVVDTPLEFIDRFGSSVRAFNKMNISRFTGMPPKEVERALNVIRHYTMSEGIGIR